MEIEKNAYELNMELKKCKNGLENTRNELSKLKKVHLELSTTHTNLLLENGKLERMHKNSTREVLSFFFSPFLLFASV